jgi:transposase
MVRVLRKEDIILMRKLRKDGKHLHQIARGCKISLSTAFKHLKYPKGLRFYSTLKKKRIQKFSENKLIERIKKYAENHNCFRAQDIKSGLKIQSSLRTVQRLCVSAKLQLRGPKTKPTLKDTHKEQRLEWAKQLLRPTIDVEKVLFDDEAGFKLRAPEHYRRMLLPRNHKRIWNKLPDYHSTLFVWDAIGYGFKSKIITIHGKVTGEVYRSFLEENLIKPLEEQGCKDKVLITDNAPWHIAKDVKMYLGKCDISVLPLPPYSPDLNPIENLWHAIKQIVYRDGRSYNSLAELQTRIENVWNDFPQEKINELVTSLADRMISIVIAHGDSTKY